MSQIEVYFIKTLFRKIKSPTSLLQRRSLLQMKSPNPVSSPFSCGFMTRSVIDSIFKHSGLLLSWTCIQFLIQACTIISASAHHLLRSCTTPVTLDVSILCSACNEPNLTHLPYVVTVVPFQPSCFYLSDEEYGNLLAQIAVLVIQSFQSVKIYRPRSSMCNSINGIALKRKVRPMTCILKLN